MQDQVGDQDVTRAGRALADRLKDEARWELPLLLAAWDASEVPDTSAA